QAGTPMGTANDPSAPGWARIVGRFERVVIFALMALLMVVVGVSTGELGWVLGGRPGGGRGVPRRRVGLPAALDARAVGRRVSVPAVAGRARVAVHAP